jgi:glycosyltransferase involved in cell wall biosynthesis
MSKAKAKVSIILPTYNRAGFLPRALDAIRNQSDSDWELIVVDDGSTDDTRHVVNAITREWPQPTRYFYQENRGAYGARNAGLDCARGDFIAFYDSDDVWMAHHLRRCLEVLGDHPEIDWVYAACRIVEYDSGREVAPNTFYIEGRPRPFLRLDSRPAGRAKLIVDPEALCCTLTHGLYCGLQNSVIRSCVFEYERFQEIPRNECEDQVFVARAIASGRRFAYLEGVHVDYVIHAQNSSAAGFDANVSRKARVIRELVTGFESFRLQVDLCPNASQALDKRLAREYFWNLGYLLFQHPERRSEALLAFERGLKLWPWDLWQWKTYMISKLRTCLKRTL